MIKQTRRTILAILAAPILLAGCATANGPQFTGLDQVKEGDANVYLYRKEAFFASGTSFAVKMDGKPLGELYNASFQKVAVRPGKYVLEVDPGLMAKKSVLEVNLEANRNYFYEYDFPTGPLANTFFIGSSIQSRDQAKALDDLKALKRAN